MSKNISSFNNNSIPNDDLEIDLNYLFKFFIRNKIFIGGITFLLTIGAFLFSFSLKKVWQGEFQIVVSEKNSQQFPSIDPNISSLLRGGALKNDLQTQVGILNSPSVLMPIFEYVYDQKKLKANNSNISFLNLGNSDMSFLKWKKNLNVNLKKNTSILEVEYKDTDNYLILPVLGKISEAYQEYSGKNDKRKRMLLKNYLINQISFFKEKSFNSFKIAQEYAIDQNLFIIDSPFSKIGERQGKKDSGLLIPNIQLENIRINAANEIKRIDVQLKKINEIGDDYEKLQYIGSTIPGLVREGLPDELAEIEKALVEKRSKYNEGDRSILRDIEKRLLIIKLLKNRAVGYLEAQKIELQSTMEAAMRPKEVLLKYKELIREAMRDETTLINLENQLRIVELDEAKLKDPWQLITNPTLLKNKIAPSRSRISLLGLFLGFFASSALAYFKEKKSGKIYDLKVIEKLLSVKTIETLFVKDEELEIENINFLKLFIDKQECKTISLLCTSNSHLKVINKLKSHFIEKKVNKEIIVFQSLEDFKDLSFSKNLLIVDLNYINNSEINYLNKYLTFIGSSLEGLVLIENI